MEFYLKKVLTDYEKNWIDSVLSGIVSAIYFEIKDYYNNEFCYMEGVAQSRSDRSAAQWGHTVYIKDEDSGEKIYMRFHYKGTIEQGDRLKIKYLPNSRHAILLKINGRKQSAG